MTPLLLAILLQADARAAGAPVPEPATLHSLGIVWTIQGDANRNAVVKTQVRRPGAAAWKPAPPLFRIERGAAKTSAKGAKTAGKGAKATSTDAAPATGAVKKAPAKKAATKKVAKKPAKKAAKKAPARKAARSDDDAPPF